MPLNPFKRQPTQTLKGPCYLKRGAATYLSKGDVKVNFGGEYDDVETLIAGKAYKILTAATVKISFTPSEFSNLDQLFAFCDFVLGQSIFPDPVGEPLEIFSRSITPNKTRHMLFSRIEMTKPTNLKLGAKSEPFSDIEWTGLPDLRRGGLTAKGSLCIEDELNEPFNPPAMTPANVMRLPFVGILGDVIFDFEDGASIDFSLKLENDTTARTGTHNMTVEELEVTCKFKAKNISEADWRKIAKLYGDVDIGQAIGINGPDLIIRGEKKNDFLFTLHNVDVAGDKEVLFSRKENFYGELTFTAFGNPAGKKFSFGRAAEALEFADYAPLP